MAEVTASPNQQVLDYTKSFFQAKGDALSCLLNLGRIVHDAHQNLNREDFKAFVFNASVGSTSTVKKLRAIGKMHKVFSDYVAQLPPNWTTVYKIARIPEPTLLKLFETNVINPSIEGKQVDAYLPVSALKDRGELRAELAYAIVIPETPDEGVRELIAEFKMKLEQFGVRFKRFSREELDI